MHGESDPRSEENPPPRNRPQSRVPPDDEGDEHLHGVQAALDQLLLAARGLLTRTRPLPLGRQDVDLRLLSAAPMLLGVVFVVVVVLVLLTLDEHLTKGVMREGRRKSKRA